VDFPGASDTVVLGVNARGDFVGQWDTGITATVVHGFVFTKGQYISFRCPGRGSHNDPGERYQCARLDRRVISRCQQQPSWFLLEGPKFTSLDYPGAAWTAAWGINSAGQIGGNHFDTANSPMRGFIAQPRNKGKP